MKSKFIELYLDIAERISQLSYAERLKVGAVVVKDNRILSYGYNGTPSGFDNKCEYEVPEKVDLESRSITEAYTATKPEVIHAEQNALIKVARSNESTENSSMFLTHSPCIMCAKLICQSGINEVYFKRLYRSYDGIELLQMANIKIINCE